MRWPPVASVRRFRARDIRRTLPYAKTALRACKWPLRLFCLWGYFLSCWIRAQKCGLRAVEWCTSGGSWAGSIRGGMGKRKPAPGKPRAGGGSIQDFFAVSQIIMIGSSKTNRTIKRGSPPRRFVGTAADHQAGNHIVPDRTCGALGIGCNLSGSNRLGCAC